MRHAEIENLQSQRDFRLRSSKKLDTKSKNVWGERQERSFLILLFSIKKIKCKNGVLYCLNIIFFLFSFFHSWPSKKKGKNSFLFCNFFPRPNCGGFFFLYLLGFFLLFASHCTHTKSKS